MNIIAAYDEATRVTNIRGSISQKDLYAVFRPEEFLFLLRAEITARIAETIMKKLEPAIEGALATAFDPHREDFG